MTKICNKDWYENQYQSSLWLKQFPNRKECLSEFLSLCCNESSKVRTKFQCELNVPYGTKDNEKIDYYFPENLQTLDEQKDIFVYIHGGYFQEGSRDMYGFVAQRFVENGTISAIIGYDLCPGISIEGIINQVIAALLVISQRYNGRNLIVMGHSAGAYLAAAATRNISCVASLILISGVYNLSPLIFTTLNDKLNLTEESALNLNLVNFKGKFCVKKALILVGSNESPEFYRQSTEFYQRMSQQDMKISLEKIPNEDHFSIIERFAERNSEFLEKIVKYVEL